MNINSSTKDKHINVEFTHKYERTFSPWGAWGLGIGSDTVSDKHVYKHSCDVSITPDVHSTFFYPCYNIKLRGADITHIVRMFTHRNEAVLYLSGEYSEIVRVWAKFVVEQPLSVRFHVRHNNRHPNGHIPKKHLLPRQKR